MALCSKAECPEERLILPKTGHASHFCYWHYIARTSGEAQLKQAKIRKVKAGTELRSVPSDDPLKRWCAGCQTFVPKWYVPKDRARCRACAGEDAYRSRQKSAYGLVEEVLDKLRALQKDRCAICRGRQTMRRLATDHDHSTEKVRGLLCKRCNHDLLPAALEGVATPAILLNAAYYLLFNPIDVNAAWVPLEDMTPEDVDRAVEAFRKILLDKPTRRA